MNHRNPCGICGDFDHLSVECFHESDEDSVALWNSILRLSEEYRRERADLEPKETGDGWFGVAA